MPSVTYNGQSFLLDGRRLWLLGAAIDYARIDPGSWRDAIAAARQAGFNMIATSCPWLVHEPRPGRYAFEDGANVRRFIELCAEAGMRVLLRAGPFVGGGYDGGGLPGWLLESEGIALREANEAFLQRVNRYLRRLLSEVTDLQITRGGPIVLVQVEDGWTCGNDDQARAYLGEVARMIREAGVTLPLLNADSLWVESSGTLDTWRGGDDLLVNLRQLHTVQPKAPRVLNGFQWNETPCWGDASAAALPATEALRRLAEILAAGAQPIVAPFCGGTNFGFLGGRLPGRGTVTTAGAARAPLGEAGHRGETYRLMKRLITFAGAFGHVFGDLDPDYQPPTIDPRDGYAGGPLGPAGPAGHAGRAGQGSRRASAAHRAHKGFSIVPLRGSGGRLIFAFGAGERTTTLVLDNGTRLPIDLGTQPVGWYAFGVDLHGTGRLDYANLCPWTIIDRSIVVFFGAAGSEGLLSVNETPLHVRVPSGMKPAVIDHQGVKIAVLNEEQVDAAYHDRARLWVGALGLDAEGQPILPAGGAWVIDREEGLAPATAAAPDKAPSRSTSVRSARAGSLALRGWEVAPADRYASGESARYASLPGPQSLAACGASSGYGWYRVRFTAKRAGKRLVHMPQWRDRVHLALDGAVLGVYGVGPGAAAVPIDVRLAAGEHVVTALVDNVGRYAGGNDLHGRAGVEGHLWEVKALKSVRPKEVDAAPVDPFDLRGFIDGASTSQKSDGRQLAWTVSHTRKSPILVDLSGTPARGTLVLNDSPIAYYAGASGESLLRVLLLPGEEGSLRRGKNVLRFAPDLGQRVVLRDVASATVLYECLDALTGSGKWAFAKWEPPLAAEFHAAPAGKAAAHARTRGTPTWWRCRFAPTHRAEPHWLDTSGLSKGQVLFNGRNLGRYFTATATGRAVGPQIKLHIPAGWLHVDKENEILIFDEHGFAPSKVRVVFTARGDLDDA